MKGHLKLLKSLDNKLNAAYASAQKSFAGRVLLKLTSEVILACLLAFAVYVATNTYHRSTAISEDNQKLKHIYISISDEYITDLLHLTTILSRTSFIFSIKQFSERLLTRGTL